MNADLGDHSVLITGASGGIGLAAARVFAAEGARLALHFHTQPEPVTALCDELGAQALPLQADLRDERHVEKMFERVTSALGRLDAIVVNAGIWVADSVPLHHMSTRQWRDTLDADLNSAFFTCRAFLRHLAADPRERASIVFVGSTAALFGEAGHADYSAAKAAMVYGLTFTLKNEIVRLAPRGRVNAVCPGWTDTPMAAGMTTDAAAVGRATATMPLRKIATPEDVAAAIVFLASDHLAGHISGAVLPVAGGMEGRRLHDDHPI